MPELSTGMTGEFRVAGDLRKVDLGAGLDAFIAAATPDVTHMMVLAHMVGAGQNFASAGDVAGKTGAPKVEVQAALDRLEPLDLVRVNAGLLGKKYAFQREGTRSDLAVKLIKLWQHPQTHNAVLQKLLGKAQGGGAPKQRI